MKQMIYFPETEIATIYKKKSNTSIPKQRANSIIRCFRKILYKLK